MSTLAIRTLNTKLQAVAAEQLFEEPEKMAEALVAFREWINKSAHLRSRTDDQFLVAFLRGCKFSLERAKQKLDMYYTLRTHIPELFTHLDPFSQKSREIIKLGAILPLPNSQDTGAPRLMLMRMSRYDPNKFTIQEALKVSVMINDILMNEDDNLIVAGLIGVIDLQGVTIQHFMQMQPFVKRTTLMLQDATPIRQKGMHYINAPKSIEKLFNLFKSFLNEKMQSRTFVHATLDSLYSVVPQKLMPREYGGEAGSLESLTEEWEKKILSYRDYFLEDCIKYGVDEKKRLGRPKNPNSLFGLEGSFKQLHFD